MFWQTTGSFAHYANEPQPKTTADACQTNDVKILNFARFKTLPHSCQLGPLRNQYARCKMLLRYCEPDEPITLNKNSDAYSGTLTRGAEATAFRGKLGNNGAQRHARFNPKCRRPLTPLVSYAVHTQVTKLAQPLFKTSRSPKQLSLRGPSSGKGYRSNTSAYYVSCFFKAPARLPSTPVKRYQKITPTYAKPTTPKFSTLHDLKPHLTPANLNHLETNTLSAKFCYGTANLTNQ